MKKPIDDYITAYSLPLTKLCLSLTAHHADAEDLFQSTWEKAIRNIKRYDSSKPFDKWLFTICVNTFRDRVRRYDDRKILRFKDDSEEARFISSLPSEENDCDEMIALRTAVARLKPHLRETVVLYYFRDYSIPELAEMLCIPEGTVKSRLSAARAELRKELKDD